ncbi:unnamed protein product [Echinostoma caproni]|uniref:Dishevelled domain-containing protein n=1 Tax=Echinostoma caproni TaxID=27848 RepID=A0A183AZ82_9TREM|nr:unnamed protein product [Echinostoma caproni]
MYITNSLVNCTFSSTKPDNGVSAKTVEPPSEQEHAVGTTGHSLEDCDTCAESDSVYSGGSRLGKIGQRGQTYETSSSMMSSDLESTSFLDSEDESSRFSTATGTSMSSAKYARHRRQRRQRRRLLPVRRVSEDAPMHHKPYGPILQISQA